MNHVHYTAVLLSLLGTALAVDSSDLEKKRIALVTAEREYLSSLETYAKGLCAKKIVVPKVSADPKKSEVDAQNKAVEANAYLSSLSEFAKPPAGRLDAPKKDDEKGRLEEPRALFSYIARIEEAIYNINDFKGMFVTLNEKPPAFFPKIP